MENNEAPYPDERAPLLGPSQQENDSPMPEQNIPTRISKRLYISHFLSAWNSRVFEFGAALYLATIYPGTLLPMSVYALTRGLSAIAFASAVGQYIDSGDRLRVVRFSIGSCVIFLVLALRLPIASDGNIALLALLAFLACVEKLCSIMNTVSVEKDWVVVIAGSNQTELRMMNAQMRRIDLICKLLGPLFIALVDGASTEAAIIVNFAMNLASVVVEYFAIATVYREVPALQQPKWNLQDEHAEREPSREHETRLGHNWRHVQVVFQKSAKDFNFYFHHRAFLPSMAGALLYLTVLNFAGQMVTYLLSAEFSATHIGISRTFSVAFEVLATWVAPWLMGRIGPVRAGLWLSSWQVSMLIAGTAVFWGLNEQPVFSATGLVVGTILSRVGLRGFDLCIQVIIQEDVEAESRGAFSSVEAAWQNIFELMSYVSTIFFSRPQDFKWPTLISVVAVACASLAYTVFAYIRRGHLIHLDWLRKLLASEEGRQREEERAIERITSRGDM